MRILLACAFSLSLILVTIASVHADAPNLLERKNPSFEEGFTRWMFDAEYRLPRKQIVADAPLGCGTNALRLTRGSAPEHPDAGYTTRLLSPQTKIKQSGRYQVSLWVKLLKQDGLHPGANVVLLIDNLEQIPIASFDFGTQQQWKQASKVVRLESGHTVRFRINTVPYQGQVFLDCFSIVKK